MSTPALGYTQPLFVLPFDHRSSFSQGLFAEENPSPETVEKIKSYKKLIYEAIFLTQEKTTLSLDSFAILVDEIYGADLLADATNRGIATMQTTEKSGLSEFDFEFGADFGAHLLKNPAAFAKALVRYNPESNKEGNQRSLEKLKTLSDFCHTHNIKLLIEPLIPPTPEQLASVSGDKRRYDNEVRPNLTVQMITDMQEAGIECDVWKIEGFEEAGSYEKVLRQARNTPLRQEVSLIILGRGETKETVRLWLAAGKNVPGVIGFAIGRTLFWEPLVALRDGLQARETTIEQIASGFAETIEFFTQE